MQISFNYLYKKARAKMKNKIRISLILLIIASIMMFSGCSKNETKNTVDNTEFDSLAITTALVHGNPSGVWFMLGTAISESLSKSYPGSIMHANPGQSAANLFRLNNNETAFALTHSSLAYEAINGLGQFDEIMDNMGGIAVFYPSPLQFVVKSDKGVTTFDDFIENKVPLKLSLSSKGGNSEIAFYNLISLYGLTREDLEDWGCKFYSIGLRDSGDSFSDGVIDGLFIMASVPTPTLQQMATNAELTMISISTDKIDELKEKHGYNEFDVPVGSYDFVVEDIASFTTYTMLGASLQTSEEYVYKVTKSLVENIDYLKTVHSSLANVSAESFIINLGMPMHPGAEKYYKEIGLID